MKMPSDVSVLTAPAGKPAPSRFPACLAFTLAEEGGFTNNPRDPGGATNLGITLNTLRRWRQDHGLPPATVDDIRALTKVDVAPIYAVYYWMPAAADHLPAGVDLMVWDFAVNAGPPRAIKQLQAAVGAQVDGFAGPQTLAAVAGINDRMRMLDDLAARRAAFYRSLPTFDVFGNGWLARTRRCLAAAKLMASQA